jgi:hypothetical protein
MFELDRLYLEDPTRGTLRMGSELRKLGFKIGRDLTLSHISDTVFCRNKALLSGIFTGLIQPINL